MLLLVDESHEIVVVVTSLVMIDDVASVKSLSFLGDDLRIGEKCERLRRGSFDRNFFIVCVFF